MANFFKILISSMFSCFLVINLYALQSKIKYSEIIIKSFDYTEMHCIVSDPIFIGKTLFVLIPDRNKAKEEWEPIFNLLTEKQLPFLTYDLRNFEEYTRENRRLLNVETEAQKANYFLKDLDAIINYLDINYKTDSNIVLVGAGIGANIAISYAVANKNIKSVILISPLNEFKTISTATTVRNYDDRPIMLLSSEEDQNSYNVCLDLMAYLDRNQKINYKIYVNNKIGMDIIQDKTTINDISEWIDNSCK